MEIHKFSVPGKSLKLIFPHHCWGLGRERLSTLESLSFSDISCAYFEPLKGLSQLTFIYMLPISNIELPVYIMYNYLL